MHREAQRKYFIKTLHTSARTSQNPAFLNNLKQRTNCDFKVTELSNIKIFR